MLRHSHLTLGVITFLAIQVNVGQGSHAVEVMYDSSVNFTCLPKASDLDLSLYNPGDLRRLWILPTGELIEADTQGHARVDVLQDGEVLHVKRVDEEDFGWYHCLVYAYPLQRYALVRHGLNLNGAYWGDLFQLKYFNMVITGLISGAVCFVTMGILCMLYNRHQARLDSAAEEEKAVAFGKLNQGFTNAAYVQEMEVLQPVTKCTTSAFSVEQAPAQVPSPLSQTAVPRAAEDLSTQKVGDGEDAAAAAAAVVVVGTKL